MGINIFLFSQSRIINFGLCGLAGFLLPEIVFSANGKPLGDDGGIKVGARKLCVIVLAPRTIGCFYDRLRCAKQYTCGLLPDWLSQR